MSPRTKEQNSLIKDERREQILNAALKVFARRGLVATKISDIASAAKLSHGLVYHYFESKEKVFIELVKRAMDMAPEISIEVNEMPLEPLEKIQTITERIIENIYGTEDSAFYFILMIQSFVSDANPEEVLEIYKKSFLPSEILLKIVEEGQKNGSISKGRPEEYVTLYWAAMQGLALNKVTMGDNAIMPNADLIVRIFKNK